MIELTPQQLVDALRKCSGTLVCEGCPYREMHSTKCIQVMQSDAAAMIEALDTAMDD